MAESKLDTPGCSKVGKSALNPLDPERMPVRERVAEVAALLARSAGRVTQRRIRSHVAVGRSSYFASRAHAGQTYSRLVWGLAAPMGDD